MYKYIGTERQLLDLGFSMCENNRHRNCYEIDIEIRDNTEYTIFQIINNVIDIRTDNYLDMVSDKAIKLFVEMVERGLIVWEE